MLNWVAMMSLPPPIQKTPYIVMPATPKAVRTGALRGRSSRWCSRWSPVIHRSTNGHAPSAPNIRPISRTPGTKTFQLHV